MKDERKAPPAAVVIFGASGDGNDERNAQALDDHRLDQRVRGARWLGHSILVRSATYRHEPSVNPLLSSGSNRSLEPMSSVTTPFAVRS